jgi:mycofactocin precursor
MTQQAVIEAEPAQVTPPAEQASEHDSAAGGAGAEALVAEELLVEEVSIDGMCGVY